MIVIYDSKSSDQKIAIKYVSRVVIYDRRAFIRLATNVES